MRTRAQRRGKSLAIRIPKTLAGAAGLDENLHHGVITTPFLADCCGRLAARGKRALLVVWADTLWESSWHISKAVKTWLWEHNRQVKREGRGMRIIACQLPVKAPWLNPLEPKWVHGKRAVVEPARLLSATELEERICTYFGCQSQDHLIAQQAA